MISGQSTFNVDYIVDQSVVTQLLFWTFQYGQDVMDWPPDLFAQSQLQFSLQKWFFFKMLCCQNTGALTFEYFSIYMALLLSSVLPKLLLFRLGIV